MTSGVVSPELDVTSLQAELAACATEIARLRRQTDVVVVLCGFWRTKAKQLMQVLRDVPAPDTNPREGIGSPAGAGATNDTRPGGMAMKTVTQKDTLDFVRDRWPDKIDVQSRLNKLGEEYGEVVGAFVKMHDDTGRKRLGDLAQETAQMVICAMALAEAAGFDLAYEIDAEWERATVREWPTEEAS